MSMEWINVEKELPNDFVEVLYFAINDTGVKEIMTGHRERGFWTHCCLFYGTTSLLQHCNVTHWMPLPNYPNYPK